MAIQEYYPLLKIIGLIVLAVGVIAWIRHEPISTDPDSQESLFEVQIDGETITCIRPNGVVESFQWDELQRIGIMTTDEGPYLLDVFWIFHSKSGGAVIPQGATGLDPVATRAFELPNFDNEAFTLAMSSTENASFPVWQRPS